MRIARAYPAIPEGPTGRGSVERRLALIGPYPPPYGGVTIHLQRLRTLLLDKGIPFTIYNAGTASSEQDGSVVNVRKRRSLWMLGYSLFGRERSVYLHAPRLETFCAGYYMAQFRAKTVMLCLHNGRLVSRYVRSRLGRWVLRTLFAPVRAIICVNRETQSMLISAGVDQSKLHHCPAFLPPALSPENGEAPDPEMARFCAEHSPLLAANGRVAWHDGADLYGLDLLVELTARLKDHRNMGMLICLAKPDARGMRYLEDLKKRGEALGVSSQLMIWTKEGPFCPVLRLADMLLRPTNTDGDAISVREALYFGVPVAASDVVRRPRGTILFRNRDIDDIEAKVRAEIEGATQNRRMSTESVGQDLSGDIEAYLELISGSVVPDLSGGGTHETISDETPDDTSSGRPAKASGTHSRWSVTGSMEAGRSQ
jgi:glycosyltransferase involved in cell wall biosynthesis